MKPRPVCATVVSIVISLLLLADMRGAQAAEIRIVSPSAYEDMEGEGGGGGETSSPFRFQQVFPAEDFAALGNQPHWIVGFTVRPDQSVTGPRTAHFPDQEVRLSTTEWEPDNLSLQFDDNFGSDVTQFYRGPLNLVADAQGPGMREFYNAEFPAGVTPYLYDPSQGNLLFDVIAWQGASPSTRDDEVPGMLTAVAQSPIATQGFREGATIFQFTFVPVGDYNHNGTLDAADIDDLTKHTVGGTNPATFDLNADTLVNVADINIWVKDLFKSWIGDANLDQQFNSSDLVAVLAAGNYEADVAATWSTGDFNGSGRFDSGDLVTALADGGYEQGPRAAVSAVPEPASFLMMMAGWIVTATCRRRTRAVKPNRLYRLIAPTTATRRQPVYRPEYPRLWRGGQRPSTAI